MGKIVFDAQTAEDIVEKKPEEQLILVRHDTSPEDVGDVGCTRGTYSTGGMTSHAAVVARGWGKCCICGAGDLENYKKKTVTVGRKVLKEGTGLV